LANAFDITLTNTVLPWIEFDEQFPALSVYRRMTLEQLAQELLDRSGRGITFVVLSAEQDRQLRTPWWNLYHTAQGEPVRTRPMYDIRFPATGDNEVKNPVELSRYLLEAILLLSDNGAYDPLEITAIAGLNHRGGQNDEHIRGMAVDMSRIVCANTGVWLDTLDILSFIEEQGFITQRTRQTYLPNVAQVAGPEYSYFGARDQNFHLSIFGHSSTYKTGDDNT